MSLPRVDPSIAVASVLRRPQRVASCEVDDYTLRVRIRIGWVGHLTLQELNDIALALGVHPQQVHMLQCDVDELHVQVDLEPVTSPETPTARR